MEMKNLSKKELESLLMEVVGIYKKLEFSYTHEYCMEPDAEKKIFTGADNRRMKEILTQLEN